MIADRRLDLDADELRKVVKVPITSMQNEIVLENQCSKPHIVRGNRSSLFPELPVQRTIVMRRLVVREQDIHAVLH